MRSRTTAERLYLVYLARYRTLLAAVRRHDCDALRATELEFAGLPATEQRVLSMAVHDVVARLPRRAKTHFVRAVGDAGGAPH